MVKQTILLLLSCWIIASVLAFQPTPIQQFLSVPSDSNKFYPTSWHIGDDIVSFYQANANYKLTEGYLKISPETSQVERILVDTVASCRGKEKISLLDASYYHPTVGVFLYYCVANNSLLTIGQNYTVQDAIPISTRQTFKDVILGHNQQGYVYILGLPSLVSLPATNPTELILVDLKTKAVENHVIFSKGSDSQVFVTGYAFDSDGASYVLTKGLERGWTMVRISKIVLSGNDYELTPLANFTDMREEFNVFHNRLYVVGGYLFTNDRVNLFIFERDGTLFKKQEKLDSRSFQASQNPRKNHAFYLPALGAQIGGSTFYASFKSYNWFAYSLQNGKLTQSVINSGFSQMFVVHGGLTSGDLLMKLDQIEFTFSIKDAKTNTTVYLSLDIWDDMMMGDSHYTVSRLGTLYVFDRKKPGQLLQTIRTSGFDYYEKTANQLVLLSGTPLGGQITYTDLETFAVRTGPVIDSSAIGDFLHVNLSDPARPFFVTDSYNRKGFLFFISPATYGAISWQPPRTDAREGIMVPGDDPESFTYVWNQLGFPNVIHIDSYQLDQLLKSFTLRSSYALTTNQTQREETQYFDIGFNKVLLSHKNNITVVDLALKTFKIYDAAPLYNDQSKRSARVFYDKNKTPYVSLSETHWGIGIPNAPPQLFDFSGHLKTMPGVIPHLTRSAMAFGNCNYALGDEIDDTIKITRLFDTCQASQGVKKISV